MKPISGKQIVLGVCGGIAAYKSVELLRLFQKAGADVKVVMTENAQQFVGSMTFEAISGHPVFREMYGGNPDAQMRHIAWAEAADAVVIAPATANIIGKLANGIADDALTTLMLAVTAPKIICPSMNTHMYENRAVQRNLDVLEGDGYVIVDPGEGELACGSVGAGRLPEPEYIFDRVAGVFSPKDFKGKRVLVTAGPTREFIDPVRFVSNPSSGKMGYAVAKAAADRGADVTLVSGPTGLETPFGVRRVDVVSAAEMAEAVLARMNDADIIIKVAAVADYTPMEKANYKIKKTDGGISVSMERTVDILVELGRRKTHQILVGFAAETQDLKKNALEKLKRKNLDMIAGNLVNDSSSGFNSDTNKLNFFYKDGSMEELPEMDKEAAAHVMLDRITSRIIRR
ncbi:MAG: bifunctional phosphopantothenoylcysteine decarboxylase/phosphopantothenate--cysteine ligase CoaBC [Desulfobacterales bacterium CG23_combo_of_CG06-09_8_20_14_all_51_8]|nr:MAG: bifunctional phosphopantothenoylcysteine decarboxylase/phosphopantothenate--cysteine ligase CoaBC [Desulfobacterales bacterium CG23_combo_of_CG06-09_8_20_14_all_51_8]